MVEKVNDGRLVQFAGAITDAAKRIERVVTPPDPVIIVDRKATFKAFFWGNVIGILAAVILIYYVFRR